MVTEQKNYVNGELESTATFEYDDHGRPTMAEFPRADGSGRRSELEYDKQGNLIGDLRTYLYAEGEDATQQVDWNLTYTDDLLTRAEMLRGEAEPYVLNLSYDDDEQLVLVEYPQPEEGMGGDLWQSYAYDEDGKLISETRCTYQHSGGSSFENVYSRVCYFYDDEDRLTEQYYCSARSDTQVSPEELDELDFEVSPLEHYFFYYDEKGNFAYLGDGAEDTHDGGEAWIYSDENYTFDENGNLVRVDQGKGWGQSESSWIEYTYEAIEIKKSDVAMHKRLIHGISNFTLSYTVYNTMDPLYWAICPATLYHYHLCQMSFYYLIPYPQFELFLKK